MKKKFFASLMAMVMVFGLAACGGSSEPAAEGDTAEGGAGGIYAYTVLAALEPGRL